MSTVISFENRFEEPITKQEAGSLDEFYKVTSVNGMVSKKERYDNHIPAFLVYYPGTGETETQAVLSILAAHDLRKGFEIRVRENSGIYMKETRKLFSGTGVYEDWKEILLFDVHDRLVYERVENAYRGKTTIEIKKFFYDPTNNVYELMYDESGTLLGISGTGSPFVPENDHFIPVKNFPLFFPDLLKDNPYFLNGTP